MSQGGKRHAELISATAWEMKVIPDTCSKYKSLHVIMSAAAGAGGEMTVINSDRLPADAGHLLDMS